MAWIKGPRIRQDLVVLLGAVRYPISICYLKKDSISRPHRSNCGGVIHGGKDLLVLCIFCFLFTARCYSEVELKATVTSTDNTRTLYALHNHYSRLELLHVCEKFSSGTLKYVVKPFYDNRDRSTYFLRECVTPKFVFLPHMEDEF
jgi:hypothetical protein